MGSKRKQIWVDAEFKNWLDSLKESDDSYRRVTKKLYKKCRGMLWR